jgi:hypothetical protein
MSSATTTVEQIEETEQFLVSVTGQRIQEVTRERAELICEQRRNSQDWSTWREDRDSNGRIFRAAYVLRVQS